MRFFFLLLFLFPCFLNAQNLSPLFFSGDAAIDSVCSEAYRTSLKKDNPALAMQLADSAKQIAINRSSNLGLAKANATLAWIFLHDENLQLSEEFVRKAMTTVQPADKEATAILQHQLGIVLDKQSRMKETMDAYLHAAKYYEEKKIYNRQAQLYSDIGRLYQISKDDNSALQYYARMRRLLDEHPDPTLDVIYYSRHMLIIQSRGMADSAIREAHTGISVARQNGALKYIPDLYYNLAGAYYDKGDRSSAMRYVDSAIAFAREHNFSSSTLLIGKAQLLAETAPPAEVEAMLLSALAEEQREHNDFMVMQGRQLLADFYESNHDYAKALEQTRLANKLKDSIGTARQAVMLKEAEYRYADEQKQKLLESYRTGARLKNWLIAAFVIIGLTIGYLLINARKSMRIKQQLFSKKEKLLTAEKEKAEMEKELESQQKERAIINEKLKAEENQRIMAEKSATERELASVALYVQEKNRMLEDLQAELDGAMKNASGEQVENIRKINKSIRQSLNFEMDWEKIKLHFEKIYPAFFTTLQARCPQLTQNELKQCAYIRMNLSNKETSNLLGIDYNSVKMSRYRIKKKLALEQEDDLFGYIQNI